MKKNNLLLFAAALTFMFISTPVMAFEDDVLWEADGDWAENEEMTEPEMVVPENDYIMEESDEEVPENNENSGADLFNDEQLYTEADDFLIVDDPVVPGDFWEEDVVSAANTDVGTEPENEGSIQIDGVFEFERTRSLVIPGNVREIKTEAFANVETPALVVIPKSVERIDSRAFAGCTGLSEVYVGNNPDMYIAPDAFEGNEQLTFYVFPDTSAELYALSHGYYCGLMEEGSSFLQRALNIVAASGGTEMVLQSSDFTSMRLIVKTVDDYLPDISEYNPVEIARDEDETFMIRFSDVEDTIACYYFLISNEMVIYADSDANQEMLDEVMAAGTVDGGWDTDDPMGFDVYSPYVATNGDGSVTIAVLDSGVSQQASYSGILTEGMNLVPDGQNWSYDPSGHGSAVASVIKDCVGDANVRIMPIRVVGGNGIGSLTLVGAGIKAAIDAGVDIINISMNFDANSYVTQWISEAVNRGITVVVAAGNNSRDIQKVYPAYLDGVYAVSGINSSYQLSGGSNYGNNIVYCAPDTGVSTTAFGGSLNGTSFSAPMISSALALVKLDPYHTLEDLNNTCRDLGVEGRDSAYGFGLPQLDNLANVYTESVTLDNSTPAQIALGTELELSWSILPEYATDKTVTVTTSDENIIKVTHEADGRTILSAEGVGTANVKVKANNASIGADVSVTAAISVVKPVTGISVVGIKNRLVMNKTLNLSAEIQPEDATSPIFTWHTTNENVAVINEDGVLMPIAPGTVGVYASADDGYGASSEMVSVQVVEVPDAESIVLSEISGIDISSGSFRMIPDTTIQLTAKVLPEDAEQAVVWNCVANPEGSITIDKEGVVNALSAGTATVTATAENGIQKTLEVEAVILPTVITVSGGAELDVGASETLELAFEPDTTTDRNVVWTSTRPEVATVTNKGVVTGVSAGTVSIIATSARSADISGALTITVRQPYTVMFDSNGGKVGPSSKVAYSGYAVGELPTPSKDYNNFLGWFTQAAGGDRVTAESRLESSNIVTLYAHWQEKPISNWVLASAVPADAAIVNTKTETTNTTTSKLDGWTGNGWHWEAQTTFSYWYSTEFPSGYYKGDKGGQGTWIYRQFLKGPVAAYENATNKRVVNNQWAGYVYWHWTYNSGDEGDGISGRHIYIREGTGPATGYGYYHRPENHWGFGAFASSTNYSFYGTDLSEGTGTKSYLVTGNVSGLNENGTRAASRDFNYGCTRWFRFNYYKSTYTDYVKKYDFKRTMVQYREK